MSDEKTAFCPRCKLHWERVVMTTERGSWTGETLLRCPECRLVDYPHEDGPRRYGSVIFVRKAAS